MANGKKFFRKKKTANDKHIARVVRQIANRDIETKMHDFATNATAINWLGSTFDLAAISQGSRIYERDGVQVRLTYLDLKLTVYEQVATLPQNRATLRFIVFRWLENTGGTAPAPTLVLQPNTLEAVPVATVGTAIAPFSMYNSDWSDSVAVVWDSGVMVPHNSTPQGSYVLNKRINLHNAKMEFNDGAVTSGTGKLYMMAISDISNLVAGQPTITFDARTLYKDG